MNIRPLTSEQQQQVERLIPEAERIARSFLGPLSEEQRSDCHLVLCEAVASHDPEKWKLSAWIYASIRQYVRRVHQKKKRSQKHREVKYVPPANVEMNFNEAGVFHSECGGGRRVVKRPWWRDGQPYPQYDEDPNDPYLDN